MAAESGRHDLLTLTAGTADVHIPAPAVITVERGRLLLFLVEESGLRHFVCEAGPGARLLLPQRRGAGPAREAGLAWHPVPAPQARIRAAPVDPAAPAAEVMALARALLPPDHGGRDWPGHATVGDAIAAVETAWCAHLADQRGREAGELARRRTTRRRGLVRALSWLGGVVAAPGRAKEPAFQPMDARVQAIARAAAALGTPLDSATLRRLDALAGEMETGAGDGGAGGPDAGDADAEAADAAAAAVERLLAAAGIFFRRVRLAADWWTRDHGVLLLAGADGVPVPACPRAGTYELMRDQGAIALRDGERAAAQGRAWMLAARLPGDGPVGLGTLLRHAGRGMGRDAARFLALTLVAGLLSLAVPLATGAAMANVIPEADHPLLLTLFFAMVAAAAAQAGVSLAAGLATVRAEGRAGNRVQEAVWDRLLRLPVSFFRRFDVGDLTNRALAVDSIRAMASMHAVTALTHGVFGLFSLALMVWYDLTLGLVVAVLGLVFGGLVWLVGRIVLREVSAVADDTGRLEALIFQFVQAIAKIRVAGAVAAAFTRFAALYRRLLAASRRQMAAAAVLQGLSSVWPILTFAVLVAVLALVSGQFLAYFRAPADWAGIEAENLRATISAPSFIAFYTALGQFSLALVMVSGSLLQLVAIRPWAERLRPLLDAEPERTSGGARRPGRLRGRIALHGVCFRYAPEAPRVLDGVSLKVEPGEMVALVGPSGAGKSTIIRLLLGFEEPEEGSIFIDGIDLKRLDPAWFRRQIGVVLQDGRLLPGSIFQNIAAGARITREQAMEAIRMAGMEKDLEAMPMGLETMLSEGATTLSGGQRQRLMIARALVRRPKLVIFDEATSALDNETQAVVTESLNRLAVTRIVVAHRLSTIRAADRIHVLDHGRVVEEGRIEELLAADGLFRRLAERQMLADLPAASA